MRPPQSSFPRCCYACVWWPLNTGTYLVYKRIVCLNASIENCILHNLVSSVVEDLKYVRPVVALLGQLKL
jgi:hypothetical protein